MRKKLWVAYVLAVPFGCLGLHRFYLGRRWTGALMLIAWLCGLIVTLLVLFHVSSLMTALLWNLVAGLLMSGVWVWELIDLILIPWMVRTANAAVNQDAEGKPPINRAA
jgi:TM2 domain-containing membrane protein YozV